MTNLSHILGSRSYEPGWATGEDEPAAADGRPAPPMDLPRGASACLYCEQKMAAGQACAECPTQAYRDARASARGRGNRRAREGRVDGAKFAPVERLPRRRSPLARLIGRLTTTKGQGNGDN